MTTSTAVSDEAFFTVDSLLHYMGGDERARTVVAKIVRDALASGTAPMELAGAAVRAGDYAQAAGIFHSLRGSIGTLGTRRFVRAALAVEEAMAVRRQESIPVLLDQVENEFRQALNHARSWLDSNEAGNE